MKLLKLCLSGVVLINLALLSGCASTSAVQGQVDQNTAAIQSLDAESFFKQGMQYSTQKDYNNAILSFKKSIEVQPTAKAYSNLGVAYLQIGKINLAQNALSKAVSMNSSDAVAHYNLAAAYSRMNQTDQALIYGIDNYDALRFDDDLANVRANPQFRQVLERHKIFIQ